MKLCLECNIHFSEDKDKCPSDGGKLISVGNDPLIGKLIGDKYRVLCHAGKGSMAVVYKVIQESTGREMALKMLHQFLGSKEESVKRFHREAKAVSSLHHTNIISLFDFGVMPDGQPYIVTEFLDGITLAELIRKRGHLTVKEALPLMKQVCEGVSEAHKNRVIHRDLKPDNIVLQDVDVNKPPNSKDLIGHNSVRVVDFGVAKMWGEAGGQSASLTLEGKVCGSPAYMSPEQCKGADVDLRSDIYSLGVVFSEVLTGQRPFAADDLMALMLMHVNKEAPSIGAMSPNMTFPPGLSNVISKALQKNADDRHNDAEEFWKEIEAVCVGRNVKKATEEEEKPVEDWIPFSDSAGIAMPGQTKKSGEGFGNKASSPNSPEEAMSRLDPSYDWARSTTEFAAVKKKKKLPINMSHFKAAVYLTVVILSVTFMVQTYASWNDTRIANQLLQQNNFEGCVQILENVKKTNGLSQEYQKKLDHSYLALAKKSARLKDFQAGIEYLDKVSDDPVLRKEVDNLKKRYRARIK